MGAASFASRSISINPDLSRKEAVINQSPYFTKREASEYLRCTERHVDRLRQAGRLQTVKLAGSAKAVRFRREAIEALAR